MKTKILLAFLILTLTIGIASASDLDLNTIKVPDSYKIIDEDTFLSETSNLEIDIEEFDLEDINETDKDSDNDDTPFKNNTNYNYTVVNGNVKNTVNFTDGINNMYGCIELVQINGQKYTVTIWDSDGDSNKIIKDANSCLEKINQLNNFEPLDITSYQ